MEWFKMICGLRDDPDISRLSDREFRQWVYILDYCAERETDGMYTVVGKQPSWFQGLVDKGRLVPMGNDEYFVKGWDKRQKSRAELDELRSTRRQAGSKGLAKRWQTDSKDDGKPIADLEVDVDLEQPTPLSATQTSPLPFDEFWGFYPHERRQGKGAAKTAWDKALQKPGVTVAMVLEGVCRLAADPNLPVDEPTLIPLPSTWLNQERWGDGPQPRRNGKSPRTEHPLDRRARELVEEVNRGNKPALKGDGVAPVVELPRQADR